MYPPPQTPTLVTCDASWRLSRELEISTFFVSIFINQLLINRQNQLRTSFII